MLRFKFCLWAFWSRIVGLGLTRLRRNILEKLSKALALVRIEATIYCPQPIVLGHTVFTSSAPEFWVSLVSPGWLFNRGICPLDTKRSADGEWNWRKVPGATCRRTKQERQTWSLRGSETARKDVRSIQTVDESE